MTSPAMPLVLVVDDEPQIQRFLRPALTAAGYRVAQAGTGAEALRLAATLSPAVVILDLGLPDMDGKDVLAALRERGDVPVVVLSARDREAEKIAALDLGANDFVNKPFGIGELLARLRVATRMRGPAAEATPILRCADLVVDIPAHRVTKASEPVHLTPREFDLLAILMRHAGRVMTHRQLLAAVWGPAHVEDTQYLRVFIGQLRQKIEADPAEPRLVLTEPGVGYRFGIE
jgi:two-component system, OmpR family, KDP operon response regulator KdpE